MPTMTSRWRNAAVAFGVLGFIAVAIQGNMTAALLNAAIWFGAVYLIFLVVHAVRRAMAGRADTTTTVMTEAEPDNGDVSPDH